MHCVIRRAAKIAPNVLKLHTFTVNMEKFATPDA